MTRVYLGLGTNLGDRPANLARACDLLAEAVHLTVLSGIVESEPVGFADQPPFLNQVAEGETELLPGVLLGFLKGIEARLGRTPTFRYGPRLIDLDLLYYGDWVMEAAELAIPHPRRRERSFVLGPLAEIAPEWRDPATGLTAAATWAAKRPYLARSWPYGAKA
ncbi:MAG: 2-amino-4-hydroxy-6-hydroxymethyldihydropteridine diphosphokinase [Bacteroidota bacterium]